MVNDETGYKIEFNLQHTLERGFPHDILYLMLPCLPVSDAFYYYSNFTLQLTIRMLTVKSTNFAAKNFVFWKRNRKWS